MLNIEDIIMTIILISILIIIAPVLKIVSIGWIVYFLSLIKSILWAVMINDATTNNIPQNFGITNISYNSPQNRLKAGNVAKKRSCLNVEKEESFSRSRLWSH